jgi:hypothetical protein
MLQIIFRTKFEVFATMKIQVEVFWVVTQCSDVVGYQHEDRGSKFLRNVGIQPQHYVGGTTQQTTIWFYLKHFSIWCTFNEVHRKIFDAYMQCNISTIYDPL